MKFSIVTVNYNMAPFLERAMQSVFEQRGVEVEYIVIDGGSIDGSVDIIKKHANKLAYWVSEPDGGQSDALNKGLSRCTGDVVAWLNADDYYEPGALLKVAEVFKNNPDYGVVVGGCRMFEEGFPDQNIQPRIVNEKTLSRYWNPYFIPPQPAIFWKKSVMDKVGILNKNYRYCMDLDLWLRFSKITTFCCIPDILAHYEVHPLSKSGSEGRFNKFVGEWTHICKQHVASASWKFRLWHNGSECMYRLNAALVSVLYGLKHSTMAFLGFGVGVIKRLTGIRQLGILTKKAE